MEVGISVDMVVYYIIVHVIFVIDAVSCVYWTDASCGRRKGWRRLV